MSLTIWKYPLKVTHTQTVNVPFRAEFLTVQVQHGQPMLWALVNPKNPKVNIAVHVVGTGHDASHVADCQYVGTFQLHGGRLVFHVFV